MKRWGSGGSVDLHDVTGAILKSFNLQGSEDEPIDVSHLAPGIYLLRVGGMAPLRFAIAR